MTTKIVQTRPTVSSGWTSPYPIVPIVITLMYRPSNHPYWLSRSW
jgi:hypothetical protein